MHQALPAPNIQTFPTEGPIPVFDLFPDDAAYYTHAAPGVGNFDVPYGETASNWPGGWGNIDRGPTIEIVDSVDLVPKPIGVRDRLPTILTYDGTEFLSLPEGAQITLRFDEMIVDGPGPDFLIHTGSTYSATPGEEEAEIFVGPSEDDLTSLGNHLADAIMAFDLADYDDSGPVRHVKLVSLNNAGDWKGFELTGMEAINIAAPDPRAHRVVITGSEVRDGLDFGRNARDPPTSGRGWSKERSTSRVPKPTPPEAARRSSSRWGWPTSAGWEAHISKRLAALQASKRQATGSERESGS